MTKLRQKLKSKDQIENEKMTPGIIVTHGTIIATWHDVNLTHDKFFILFLNFKKEIQKIQKLTRDTSFNVITTPLTERT